uniref:snRNA-activating protein complex subunit 3 n=1 Tax=Monopterus albus TaxID=43700 RepID=A0A3Q3IJB5_MONAL
MAAAKLSTDTNTNIPEYEYTDVNTKPFHIGSFRNEWLNRLKPSNYSYQAEDEDAFEANFAEEMGVGPEIMTELKSVCSLESLRCHPEDQQPDTEVVPQDATLKTLVYGLFSVVAICCDRLTVGRKPEVVADLIPEGEVILTINVYYPAVFEKHPFKLTKMRITMFIFKLDAICCVSDLQVYGEFSNTPDIAPDFVSKDHFKSAFFFFEGVFYNDMRFPECQDISMTTIEWAKACKFPPYRQAKMEDTRFMDLKVKVGFPYLYCHQGDCEHLVIFTDVRLVLCFLYHCSAAAQLCDPVSFKTHSKLVLNCKTVWFTTNDQFAPCDPCLFCDKCFRMLHYDAEGKKLGQFLAYPYVDRGAFN